MRCSFRHVIVIRRRRTWKGVGWVVGPFWRGVGLQHTRGFCGYPVNCWGNKRPPNGPKFDRRPTDDVPRPLDKSRPIPRTFFSCRRNKIRGVQRGHERASHCETDNGEKDRMHETNTNANEMHIVGNGKSRSYKYGKLHPGCYNTPPLREDLIPRSRTERTPDIQNGGGPRVPMWLPGRNGATTSLSGI